MALGENLKIGHGAKRRVGIGGELRTYGLTEIFYRIALPPQCFGINVRLGVDADVGVKIEEMEDERQKVSVEIYEIPIGTTIDGFEIVGIIAEEGTAVVGRDDGLPMLMAPVAMIADANVAHGGARCPCRFRLYGNGEWERTIIGGYDAAIAIGLLHIMVRPLFYDGEAAIELRKILYGRQIGRSKEYHGGKEEFIGLKETKKTRRGCDCSADSETSSPRVMIRDFSGRFYLILLTHLKHLEKRRCPSVQP